MAAPSVTYTFANSTTADATQVNQNFADVIAGVSDGTKDISVATVTVSGNTVLGDLSTDDLTINSSLASDLLIKTQYTYSIGSSTKGLKYAYFGSADSAAYGVRVAAGTLAASWNLTLPVNDGESGQFLKTNGSGVSSWAYPFQRLSKAVADTGYSLGADVTHVDWDASGGACSQVIPAAGTSNSGQTAWIRKTDSSFNAVTLSTGVSTTLNTIGECVQIQSNGSAWVIVGRFIPGVPTSYTPTNPLQATSTNPTLSTDASHSIDFWYTRVGKCLRIQAHIRFGTTGVNAGNGNYLVALPNGLVVEDPSPGPVSANTTPPYGRANYFDNSATASNMGYVSCVAGEAFVRLYSFTHTAISNSSPWTWANNDVISVDCVIPIDGWNG